MSYNTKHFDHEAHYASKSTKELEKLLEDAKAFAIKYPQFKYGWHNVYVQDLKRRIAERIGKGE